MFPINGKISTVNPIIVKNINKSTLAVVSDMKFVNNTLSEGFFIYLYSQSPYEQPVLMYKIQMDPGDFIQDTTTYNLKPGHSLVLKSTSKNIQYTVNGFESIDPVPNTGMIRIYDLTGALKVTGGSVPTGNETVSFVAQEDIQAFDPVFADGFIADSDVIAKRNKVIGIATAFVANGFVGQAKGFGSITNPGWSWVVGDRIFLKSTQLSINEPGGGFIQLFGVATAPDTIDVKLAQSILL